METITFVVRLCQQYNGLDERKKKENNLSDFYIPNLHLLGYSLGEGLDLFEGIGKFYIG